MKILNALDTHGPMQLSELARAVKVSKSTISRGIKDLIISKTVRFGADSKYRSAEHFDVVETEPNEVGSLGAAGGKRIH